MKTLFNFCLIAIFGIAFASYSLADSNITLAEAIAQGKVKIEILPFGTTGWDAMQVNVKNISGAKMKLIIPKGTLFVPDINDEQTLITSEDEIFALNAGQEKLIARKGFCTELHDHGSKESSTFTFGFSGNTKLMNLINYMDSIGITNEDMIQNAVWSITDNSPVGYIESDEDTTRERLLRQRVCALTAQAMPWYDTESKIIITPEREFIIQPTEVTGEIVINSDVPITLQGVVKDATGKVLYTNPNQSHAPDGETTFDYVLHVEGWEKGTYYVVYTCNGKEVINQAFEI